MEVPLMRRGHEFSTRNMYIKQSCAKRIITPTAGNFKIRQTGQETQPWVIMTGSPRAPGTSIAPNITALDLETAYAQRGNPCAYCRDH